MKKRNFLRLPVLIMLVITGLCLVNTGPVVAGTITYAKPAVYAVNASLDLSSPSSSIVKGSRTIEVARFRLSATKNATITSMTFKIGANGASAISEFDLRDSLNTVIGTAVISGDTATISNMNHQISAGMMQRLSVYQTLNNTGVSGANIGVTLDSFSFRAKTGPATINPNDVVANNIYVYRDIPTITYNTLPTNTMATGTYTIAKFTITSNDAISWKRIRFNFAKSPILTISNIGLFDATNMRIPGLVSYATTSNNGFIEFDAINEEMVSGSKTYTLKADILRAETGTMLSVNIPSLSAHAAPANFNAAGYNASFAWSDLSAPAHDTYTNDWNNDNLVKNLPTNSWTLTR